MVRVGIINVTGYAGAELARLLYLHPEAQVVAVSGRSAAGKALSQVFPHLWPLELTVAEEVGDVDFAFSALPHAASAEAVAPLVRRGPPGGGISAGLRLRARAAVTGAKWGVSAAGRTLGLVYHFAEANESVSAYALGGHRHLPVIVQALARLWADSPPPRGSFQPHPIPMPRG